MILSYDSGVWSAHWGLLDFGNRIKEIPAAFVWGRNFLVRRKIMLEVGGFHPGGFPSHLFHFTGDGDMGAGKKIEANGHKVLYHPGCKIFNIFQAHQNNPAEIKRWIFGEGLVTSYVLLRQVFAKTNSHEECLSLVKNKVTDDLLNGIGQGYIVGLKNLPTELKEIFSVAGRDGFNAHQIYFEKDPNFRKWVLRDNYLNIDECYTHIDLLEG